MCRLCDPVVNEVRAIRRRISKAYGHGIDRYFDHLRRAQESERARGRRILDAPPEPPPQMRRKLAR